MDLSKAFDVIQHDLLLAKLNAYGVEEKSCTLLRDYLFETQRVKIGDTVSAWFDVKRGVPQGSVLGPTFFNIFMNDLFYHITRAKLNVYADDHQIYHSDIDPCTLEHCVINQVEVANLWYHNNGMIVNETKHQALILGKTDYSFSFLAVRESIDMFGVNIDSKLNFSNHIRTMCKKINKQFQVMLRFRNLIPEAFILPNFDYCSSVWHFCGARNTNKMEAINRRILRFLLQDNISTYSILLSKINSKSLYTKRLQKFISYTGCPNFKVRSFKHDSIV